MILDWEGVRALAPDWDRLLRRSRADSVFLSWDWIDAWRRLAADDVRPWVIAARDPAGALVGIAPFYLSRACLLRTLTFQALRVLGDHHTGAEYSDWIADRRFEEQVDRTIAQTLAARSDWDLLWLPKVAGWTGAGARLARACEQAGLASRSRPVEFSVVALPGAYPDYFKTLSGNTRSMLRRRTREVFASPATRFERCGGEDERAAYLEALFDLNHRRWRAMGRDGSFQRKPFAARFYREFSPRALQRGWLRLFAIRDGARFRAVQAGLVYAGVYYQLQEGFDPSDVGGIGNALRGRAIESLIQEGVTAYDFMGDHTDHKRRWRGQVRQGVDLLVVRRRPRTLPLTTIGFWPTGRYLGLTGLPD